MGGSGKICQYGNSKTKNPERLLPLFINAHIHSKCKKKGAAVARVSFSKSDSLSKLHLLRSCTPTNCSV